MYLCMYISFSDVTRDDMDSLTQPCMQSLGSMLRFSEQCMEYFAINIYIYCRVA
jgi:hypothetical protein